MRGYSSLLRSLQSIFSNERSIEVILFKLYVHAILAFVCVEYEENNNISKRATNNTINTTTTNFVTD